MRSSETSVLSLVGVCLAVCAAPSASAAAPDVHQVDVVDIIHSVSAGQVVATISAAEEAGAGLVLIRLDTPGGLDTAMREIIEAILNSEVPVAVFVGPAGSRAASAGYLITLAADISGMAPGTNMGAATPISGTGGEMPETLSRKVESDAAAYLRSIAERRGRDVALAEQGVTEARSWTASEALEAGLIDLMAGDTEEFLAAIHGRTVTRIDGSEVMLDTADAIVVLTEMSFRDRALSVIANPNLAVLLGMIGLLGLYLEFSNPGLLIPGILGGIALLLAAFGLNFLPVSLLGVLLLLAGIGLLTAEALTPSFGIMGLSGAVALMIGLLFFFGRAIPSDTRTELDLGPRHSVRPGLRGPGVLPGPVGGPRPAEPRGKRPGGHDRFAGHRLHRHQPRRRRQGIRPRRVLGCHLRRRGQRG